MKACSPKKQKNKLNWNLAVFKGVWLGMDETPDESFLYVDIRVRTYRTLKRLPENQRWDPRVAVALESSSVAPWNLYPARRGTIPPGIIGWTQRTPLGSNTF